MVAVDEPTLEEPTPEPESPKPTRPPKVPQDHLKPAAQREVEDDADETIQVDWEEGISVTIPANLEDWPADAIEFEERNAHVSALRALLGSDEYNKVKADWLKATGKKSWRVRDAGRFMDAVAIAAGLKSAGD